ncbi:MAG: N-acetylmuramoyl-L-alanine amidase [Chloroflexi bacterium]|nr:N-acetylmuramoyl-L-alanine amidase [Chloroflexota bacterium]
MDRRTSTCAQPAGRRGAVLAVAAALAAGAALVVLARLALLPGLAPGFPRPAGLASGACQPFRPQAHDTGKVVFVDAGHGGIDPGAVGRTTNGATLREKDLTLAVARDLLARLRTDGDTVVMSRTSDTAVASLGPGDTAAGGLTPAGEHHDVLARIQCANAAKADLLIAIHFNSFSSASTGGAETVYDSARSFSADNLRFATAVQNGLMASFAGQGWTVPDRGVKDDRTLGAPALTTAGEQYGHLLELGPPQPGWLDQPSAMPGALTEPLFVTDRNEADVATLPQGQQAMAAGLEQTINAYFAATAPAA